MTAEEAKTLFALMGWSWEPELLSEGNDMRGKMGQSYSQRYQVFVNEVMVKARQRGIAAAHTTYEAYDLDRCLTEYANMYVNWLATGSKP